MEPFLSMEPFLDITKSMAPFLDIKSARLRPLAHTALNRLMACIWETAEIPLPPAEWDSNGLSRHGRPLVVSR